MALEVDEAGAGGGDDRGDLEGEEGEVDVEAEVGEAGAAAEEDDCEI